MHLVSGRADQYSMDVVSPYRRRLTELLADLHLRTRAVVEARPERGASLVEYALLIALLALVCFSAVSLFGNNTTQIYSDVGNSLN